MPLYEYECEACGQRFEAIRKFSEASVDVCSLCGKGPVRRLLSSPAIQFKGTGWYITDYSSKGKSGTDSGAVKSDSKKTDSASTETSTKAESAGTPAKASSES